MEFNTAHQRKNLRQIIALGGGGFSTEPENPALDRYILQQSHKPNPRICLIPSASGDSNRIISHFYTAFTKLPCRPNHLALFQRTPDIRKSILWQDILYIGGGNTKSMLAVWRDWGIPAVLQEAWESGIVLAGISAGAICWFEQGITDSFDERLSVLDCLGFLPGSCCPHYDSETDRRPTFHELLAKGQISPGYAIEDSAAIHFVDQEIYRVVASQPGKTVYRLNIADGAVHEKPINADYLGGKTLNDQIG